MKKCLLSLLLISSCFLLKAQKEFNPLDVDLSNLYRLSNAKTRSISPENFNGEKGKGGMATEGTGKNASRDLGQKWKVSQASASNLKPLLQSQRSTARRRCTTYLDDAYRKLAILRDTVLLGR